MKMENETGYTEANERGRDEVSIYIATPADAAIISKVLFEAFVQFKVFYTEKAFAATTVSPREVIQRMGEGPVWTAIKNNRIAGTASVLKKQEGLYIRGMAVLPHARGLKIGRRLLEYIQQYAAENKINRLFLFTTPYLHAAIHLYKSFGFRQIGEVNESFYGTPGFEMEKLLYTA
jgi:ribosomal protein S18 acetylase RimI-like enzyme